MMISYRSINLLWEDSRRSGVLTRLYRERIDEWRLLKCIKIYAKGKGFIMNKKLVSFFERVSSWLYMHIDEAHRRAREKLREMSKVGKFREGTWGSAGLKGDLLSFYFSLKNARVPRQILIELYLL